MKPRTIIAAWLQQLIIPPRAQTLIRAGLSAPPGKVPADIPNKFIYPKALMYP